LQQSLDRKVTDAAVGRLEPQELLLLLMILRGRHPNNPAEPKETPATHPDPAKEESQSKHPTDPFLW
jgi:hypothetical protein